MIYVILYFFEKNWYMYYIELFFYHIIYYIELLFFLFKSYYLLKNLNPAKCADCNEKHKKVWVASRQSYVSSPLLSSRLYYFNLFLSLLQILSLYTHKTHLGREIKNEHRREQLQHPLPPNPRCRNCRPFSLILILRRQSHAPSSSIGWPQFQTAGGQGDSTPHQDFAALPPSFLRRRGLTCGYAPLRLRRRQRGCSRRLA